MPPNPPQEFALLRLPRGDSISYPIAPYRTHRFNLRIFLREIRARGYEAWYLLIDLTGFQNQQIPQRQLLHAVIISRVIIFISDPEATSPPSPAPSDLAADLGASDLGSGSGDESSYWDSDQVNSETGLPGVWSDR